MCKYKCQCVMMIVGQTDKIKLYFTAMALCQLFRRTGFIERKFH